jgi:predicted Zn-dependent protease
MATMSYIVFFFACLFVKTYANKETVNTQEAEDYLAKFGYLPAGQRSGGPQQRALARNRAIAKFQDYAGLPVTGQLDEKTQRKMLSPRCGLSDARRPNNRAGVSKWRKTNLSWALTKPTSQLDQNRIKTAIRQAFAVWSAVTPLNFTEGQSATDFKFSFEIRDHGDGAGNAFDGPGMVLAHAAYPHYGDKGQLHFDNEETWVFEDAAGIERGNIDLLSVTIHELGHSLGLSHSDDRGAIMFAFYRAPELVNGKLKQFQLSQTDINDIQGLYGTREGATTRPPYVTPPGGPSTGAACPRFQASATGGDGAVYFFQNGNLGWKKDNIDAPANTATRFYVDKRFPGAPNNGITAALSHDGDKLIYLFQGRRVYAYAYESDEFYLEKGYPKDLPASVPFTPEGALQWEQGGHLVLLGGDQFVIWRPWDNTSEFLQKTENYFGKLPGKVSFMVGDQLYFVDAANVSIYNFRDRKVVETKPLKAVITC